MNGLDFTKDGVTFQYHEPAQLAAVFPAGADSAGGAVVTVGWCNLKRVETCDESAWVHQALGFSA
jgi:hypothetical protein